MTTLFKSILLLSLLALTALSTFSSCGNSQPKCSTPVAIFNKNMSHIQEHHFEIKGQESTETVKLDVGYHFEILQTGCNKPVQTYNFYLPHAPDQDPQNGQEWAELAANYFWELSGIDIAVQKNYEEWSKAIGIEAKDFQLGTPRVIGDHYKVKINGVKSATEIILTIELASI